MCLPPWPLSLFYLSIVVKLNSVQCYVNPPFDLTIVVKLNSIHCYVKSAFTGVQNLCLVRSMYVRVSIICGGSGACTYGCLEFVVGHELSFKYLVNPVE